MGIKNFYLPEFVRCPICGAALTREGGSLYCGGERRHTYDIAKEGYVNLLPPGRAKNARTGDGADMIRAREKFLAGGGYDRYSREAAEFAAGFLDADTSLSAPINGGLSHGAMGASLPTDKENKPKVTMTEAVRLCDTLEATGEVSRNLPVGACRLVDAGCGEGRHTVNMARAISECLGIPVIATGFDASKFGVQAAAKRYVRDGASRLFAAANIFSLPLTDGCADVFTSLFAPLPDDEVRRVLRAGGILVICAAGAGHLAEMREVLYDNPIPSGGGAAVPDGFETVGEKIIEYPLELSSNEEIMSLFTMTPFYHNAPPEGRARLEAKDSLTVTVQVKCTVARR